MLRQVPEGAMSGRPTENHPRDHGAPAIKGAAQVSNLASRVISLLRQKASPDRPSVSEHIVEKLLLAAMLERLTGSLQLLLKQLSKARKS